MHDRGTNKSRGSIAAGRCFTADGDISELRVMVRFGGRERSPVPYPDVRVAMARLILRSFCFGGPARHIS